jgi:hypothetical protein
MDFDGNYFGSLFVYLDYGNIGLICPDYARAAAVCLP